MIQGQRDLVEIVSARPNCQRCVRFRHGKCGLGRVPEYTDLGCGKFVLDKARSDCTSCKWYCMQMCVYAYSGEDPEVVTPEIVGVRCDVYEWDGEAEFELVTS